MPDDPDLALFSLGTVLVTAAVVGQVLIVVLHNDSKLDITFLVDTINDILVEVLILVAGRIVYACSCIRRGHNIEKKKEKKNKPHRSLLDLH